MSISGKFIDQLLEGCDPPEDILGEAGLLKQLTKGLLDALRMLRWNSILVMLNIHFKVRIPAIPEMVNPVKLRSFHGEVELVISRVHYCSFESKLGKKGEKQLNFFDERIISLYARGMTIRDIQAHFEESYDVEVSPTFISQFTNEQVTDEVK